MSDVSPSSERRAQLTALTGLLVQSGLLVFGVGAVFLSPFRPAAVFAATSHLLAGLLIWVILLIIFSLRRRSRAEDLETEQLRRARDEGRATNIFDTADESLLLERRRLAWAYRFLFPVFTVLIALTLIGGYFFQPAFVPMRGAAGKASLVPMLFMAGIAFCAFVYSRYVVGMARQPAWRLLRAGGSFLIGNAITCTIVALSLAFSQSKALEPWVEPLAQDVVRTVMLILGIEVIANLILEMYRPRRAGEEIRPAFDSRVLGLFSEPGGIVRSMAETVNYQFGFEVSGTWFYRLLQRSVLPLTALTIVALILLSCVVVIDVDEAGYVEHFGSVDKAGQQGPGLHFKLPWPVDRVMRERVDQVRFLTIGEGHDEGEDEDDDHGHDDKGAILWTEEHEFNPEILTVVANPEMGQFSMGDPGSKGDKRSRSVAVSLLMTSVAIEYKIKSLHDYAYKYTDPREVLESIAHQELSDYAAGVDLAALMGRGRQAFGPSMKKVLQKRCDDNELGIDITFVALQEAHPPSQSDVAKSFQDVVAAEMRKTADIEKAHGEAQQILTTVAGSIERSRAIDEAIQGLDRLEADLAKSPSASAEASVKEAEKRLESLLFGDRSRGISPASGRVAAMLASARAASAASVSEAESKARRFKYDVVAYRSAPELFMVRRWLDALRVELPRMRKFIFVGDKSNRENVIIEWDGKKAGTLDLSEPELGK